MKHKFHWSLRNGEGRIPLFFFIVAFFIKKHPPAQETWLWFARSKATSSAAQQETPPSMARVTQADVRCRGHPSLLWIWNLYQQVGTLDALSKEGGVEDPPEK